MSNGLEKVSASIIGYASVLTFDEFRTSGGSSTVNYTATDPGQMARDIITRAAELYPQLTWDTLSIPLVGFTTDYKFENLNWKDALDLVQKIAGVSFYWYIDQNNKVYFLEKSSSFEKSFMVGDSVQDIKAKVESDEVKNRIVFKYSSNTIIKTDAASIAAYGQRTSRVNATTITSAAAADSQAQYILDTEKNAKTSLKIVLNDRAKFYDVKPGQTVKIRGLKEGQTIIGNNLQIETISYKGDSLTLELEESRTLADHVRRGCAD